MSDDTKASLFRKLLDELLDKFKGSVPPAPVREMFEHLEKRVGDLQEKIKEEAAESIPDDDREGK